MLDAEIPNVVPNKKFIWLQSGIYIMQNTMIGERGLGMAAGGKKYKIKMNEKKIKREKEKLSKIT